MEGNPAGSVIEIVGDELSGDESVVLVEEDIVAAYSGTFGRSLSESQWTSGYVAGALSLYLEENGVHTWPLEVVRYTSGQARANLTGRSSAKDAQVNQAIWDLWGGRKKAKNSGKDGNPKGPLHGWTAAHVHDALAQVLLWAANKAKEEFDSGLAHSPGEVG